MGHTLKYGVNGPSTYKMGIIRAMGPLDGPTCPKRVRHKPKWANHPLVPMACVLELKG